MKFYVILTQVLINAQFFNHGTNNEQ